MTPTSSPRFSATPPLERVELLGCVAYSDGLELMHRRAAQRRAGEIPDTLLLLEHPPTITLGVRAQAPEELRSTPDALAADGVEVVATDRGGLATLHAPGQVVGYLICALEGGLRGLPRFVASIERWLIDALATWGVETEAHPRDVGIWLKSPHGTARRKIGSIGLALHEGVTTHGFAVNVTNDLATFRHLRPCGLDDVEVVRLADVVPTGGRSATPAAFMQSLLERLSAPLGVPAELAALVAAFNRRDAEAAADLFALDGSFENPRDGRIVGREAIRAHFAQFFGRTELARLEPHEVHAQPPAGVQDPEAAVVRLHFAYMFTWITPGAADARRSRGVAHVRLAPGGLVTSWLEAPSARLVDSEG